MSRVKLQTSLGDIVLELDAAKAPSSVDNFLQYVNDGFFQLDLHNSLQIIRVNAGQAGFSGNRCDHDAGGL